MGNLLQFYVEIVIKVYISNIIIFKNENVFSKMIFLKQVKNNIPKGVRSTKYPVAT
jgi:hypothetical protein